MENSMTEEEREIHLTFMREALAMVDLLLPLTPFVASTL
jgi:hypothetical protein